MAWTATIVSKEFVNGVPYINFEFTNGVDKATERLVARDLTSLKNQVTQKIIDLTNSESFLSTLSVGSFDSTLVVINPTQAEIDQGKWFRDWNNLKGVNQLIAAGVLTGNETRVVNLVNNVKTNFKPAYITLL